MKKGSRVLPTPASCSSNVIMTSSAPAFIPTVQPPFNRFILKRFSVNRNFLFWFSSLRCSFYRLTFSTPVVKRWISCAIFLTSWQGCGLVGAYKTLCIFWWIHHTESFCVAISVVGVGWSRQCIRFHFCSLLKYKRLDISWFPYLDNWKRSWN